MDFINRGFSSFLIIALIFVVFGFLINFLPVILVVAAGVWGISYIVKKVKGLNKNNVFKSQVNNSDMVKEADTTDFSEAEVIDVDYTEIK